MNVIQKSTVIKNADNHNGMVVLSVANNGYIKGYYPSNVKENCTIEQATFSVRIHQIYQNKQDYQLIVTEKTNVPVERNVKLSNRTNNSAGASTQITISVDLNQDMIEKIRKSNSLAKDMTDGEIHSTIVDFLTSLPTQLPLVVENLDLFEF